MFITFVFKFFEFLFKPVCWFKYAIYSLGSLKKELCSFLNNYYQVETFKPEDYGVRVYIFGGFYIYNKKTKAIIASSPDMESKFLEIKLDNMQSKEFPKNQLTELNKFCKVDETVSLWHDGNKISQIRHIITLNPHQPKNCTADDEVVYTDVCIIKRGDDVVTSIYKELYDFSSMYGNRLSLANYSNNYNIEDIFSDIIREQKTLS